MQMSGKPAKRTRETCAYGTGRDGCGAKADYRGDRKFCRRLRISCQRDRIYGNPDGRSAPPVLGVEVAGIAGGQPGEAFGMP